jgi:hypothetical protein
MTFISCTYIAVKTILRSCNLHNKEILFQAFFEFSEVRKKMPIAMYIRVKNCLLYLAVGGGAVKLRPQAQRRPPLVGQVGPPANCAA